MQSDTWTPDRSTPRCLQTGGKRVCNGHFDYWGWCMTWTRHTSMGITLWKIVAYDHPAPERIEVHRL